MCHILTLAFDAFDVALLLLLLRPCKKSRLIHMVTDALAADASLVPVCKMVTA